MPNTKDIKIDKLKILVWGKPKSGKTYLFRTFPKPAKVYEFDPNGALCLRGEDIEFDEYTGASGYRKFLVDLDKDMKSGKYVSAMIDSLTTLQQAMMQSVQEENMKATENYQIQEYGIYFIRLRRLIMDLINYPVHLLFTAHEQIVENTATGDVFILPSVYGKDMPDEFPVYFDEVYHTEVTPHRNGPAEFLLRTQPTNLYACGGRIARSGVLATLEVPDFNVILEKALGIKKEEIVITETKKGGDIKK
jgi:hypothetical protein